uniref:Uncharacterized protein n=1 Tax=viral metagenome TaxID=1070528 RepID=A0A6M3K4X2_9ZZZZ
MKTRNKNILVEFARNVRSGMGYHKSARAIGLRRKLPISFGGFEQHLNGGSPIVGITTIFIFSIRDSKRAVSTDFAIGFCVDGWWVEEETFFQVLEIQHREKHSLCWNRIDNCE